MDIEWRELSFGTKLAVVDDMPMARIWEGGTGRWVCIFAARISNHFPALPSTACKTEAGVKRRAEKYITLWAIAGRPK